MNMNDIYNEVLKSQTAPGQLFETKDVINDQGVTFKEYVHFPDSLRGFLDFGLAHGDKDWLVYEGERFTYKEVFEKSAQLGNALIDAGIEKARSEFKTGDIAFLPSTGSICFFVGNVQSTKTMALIGKFHGDVAELKNVKSGDVLSLYEEIT